MSLKRAGCSALRLALSGMLVLAELGAFTAPVVIYHLDWLGPALTV